MASFFAVLGWKLVFYTCVLIGTGAWGARWKGKATKAQDDLKAKELELTLAQNSLITMGKQVSLWKSQANAAATAATKAQTEADQLRAQYESKAQAILQKPVADKDAVQFLRDEASK